MTRLYVAVLYFRSNKYVTVMAHRTWLIRAFYHIMILPRIQCAVRQHESVNYTGPKRTWCFVAA